MKMVRAIIRYEKDAAVVRALEKIGIYAMTKMPVTGRGRQGGAQAGIMSYPELSKLMLMLAVPDDQVDSVVTTIAHAAYTGYPGDGRLFVSSIDKAVRLRTGEIFDANSPITGE